MAGILGLGRIGVLVAQRLGAFGMQVVAYDPYVPPARAAQLGVRLVSLDELLAEADFITVHLPKNAETIGLIGDRELRLVKPGVRIVNAARGGIVDEQALALALKEGRVAGAGIDVFATEPCTDSPLFGFPDVVATPHLGASTDEAQEKAGTQVARSVRLALAGEFVPDAVNVQGGAVDEDVRPGLPLAEKLGRIFTALAGGVAARIDVEVRGEIAGHDVRVLQLAALKGVFARRGRGRGDLRERAAAGQRARRRGQPGHRRGEPGLAQPGHPARHLARRPAGVGRRHAHRPAAASRSWSRSTASTWRSRPPSTWCSSPTPTGPASSARSARSWAARASTSPACRCAGTPGAGTR